jgi:S1-C subfamily serine protease
VSSVEPASFPLSRTLGFRNANLDAIRLVNPPNEVDGVLVDGQGRVIARWASFLLEGGGDTEQLTLGIPAELLVEALDAFRSSRPLRSLEVEWRMLPLAGARRLGVDEARVRDFEERWPGRRQMLSAVRSVAGAPSAALIQPGDVLLAIDGEPVNDFRAVERASQRDAVTVELWRGGEVVSVALETVPLAGEDTDRVLRWAGATLQAPHRALAAQRGIPREGVYVSWFAFGSPASRYNLWAGQRIVEVNGRATPDLDSFIDVVSGLGEQDAVRLRTINWNNVPQVITLRLDKRYWPAYELRRGEQGWERRDLE